MSKTNDSVTVICEPGIRLIVDGEYSGITQSGTNRISIRPTAKVGHQVILQKPDPVERPGACYGYLPQSFTFTLEPAQKDEIVVAPFIKTWMGVPQQLRPGDKLPPDRGYGQMYLSCDPEKCTVEFRSETIQLPTQIHDVCEGTYRLVFHHERDMLSTNVTFARHEVRMLQADFADSRIRNLAQEREQDRQRIRSLIKQMRVNAFADFPSLTEQEKDYVIGMLHGDKEWGQPDQKLICRDVLVSQGYSFGNGVGWTRDAIDLVEKQSWKDLSPIIGHIYERPKNTFVCERAFLYLRSQAGKPVSTNIPTDSQTLCAAGYYQASVTDDQLAKAKRRLLKESDEEAVLVYCIQVITSGGKQTTDRGALAAVDVLKHLDHALVAQRIRGFIRDGEPFYVKSRFEWVATRLGMDIESIKIPN